MEKPNWGTVQIRSSGTQRRSISCTLCAEVAAFHIWKKTGLTLLPRTRLWWKIVRNWSEHWKVLAMVWVRLKPEVLSIEELVFGTRLAGACRSDLIPRIFLCRTVYFPIVFFYIWTTSRPMLFNTKHKKSKSKSSKVNPAFLIISLNFKCHSLNFPNLLM